VNAWSSYQNQTPATEHLRNRPDFDPKTFAVRHINVAEGGGRVLKDSELRHAPGYFPDQPLWSYAVRCSRYVQSHHATGRVLVTRERAALIAPRFPILTLDDRRQSTGLGYIFDIRSLLPGESIVSILWKFARANGVPAHTLIQLMKVGIDPYQGVEPMRDVLNLWHLRRRLRIPGKVLRGSLLDGAQRGRHHPAFRYCRQCISLGHHSVTYQMFNENRCPAHHRMLETRCRHCGGETPYVLNASLIGSPYRCARCGALYGTRYPPYLSKTPAMRKEDRLAISRHFYNRMSGSFRLGSDDHDA
jgi:hypothetical protein